MTVADEVRATVAAGAELGDDYDRALLRSFADRLDAELDARDERRRTALLRDAVTIVIALGSTGFGVLFAAASDGLGATGATIATIVVWLTIGVVNVAHARSR